MLKTLTVKHIALIDDMTLEFHQGLTAITGETGAGKSMVLESLQLLFGKRSDQDMIRHGFEEAIVFGMFVLNEENITIERRISNQSKNLMKLNGEPVTLLKIREVASKLGHIHDQDDLFELIDPKSYVHMLDLFDYQHIEPLHSDYLFAKSSYEDALKKKQHVMHIHETKQKQDDLIRFQIQELEAIHMKENELSEIQDEIHQLKHFDSISTHFSHLKTLFEDTEIMTQLVQIKQEIESLAKYMHIFETMQEMMRSFYYELEDMKSTILSEIETLDFDQNIFETLQQREYELLKIQQKYQKSIPELMTYLEEIKTEMETFDNYDALIQSLDQEIDKKKTVALEEANKLSNLRQKIAEMIKETLIVRLLELDLPHVSFDIRFERVDQFLESGVDDVLFYISLNEGEPLKPLHKVASGGERSRFMFAFKSLQALYQGVSMLILDEIDTGISGKTASKVANQMAKLSEEMQVIVITHVPQVAAKAHTQLKVYKKTIDGRIQTFVELLNDDSRIKEIASMLSDETMSTFAIEQAKMLLKQKKDKP
jgi:DNA repair protein RecN (Recombination protein N)